MKKTLSLILSLSLIISLFSAMSGLSVYAIDNTPASTEVVEKISEETADNKTAETPEKVEGTEEKTFSATSPIKTESTAAEAKGATSGIYTYSVSNGEATVTKCNTSVSGSIEIPSTIDGYPVTSIGYRAFYGCTSLTSVTIPDSVTSIGLDAFEDCTSLTSVTIPDSVTSIGYHAFDGCTGLTSITIPDSETSIGGGAFYGCTGLRRITIPDSITYIGEYAFYNTAWYNNQPDGLVYAGKVAYKYKGTCPESVTIKDGTKSISGSAFYGCTGLTSVTIPDSVTSIGGNAFAYCNGLTSVIIGNSVTSIGSYAFQCCKLTSITIPNSVTYIGEDAFEGCGALTEVFYTGTIAEWCNILFDGGITIEENWDSISNPLKYAQGLYINNEYITELTIPDSVTSIGRYAFYNYDGLKSVTIGNGVTSIGYYAFYDCTSLTSITIPGSVTTIGENAFSGCNITTLIFADGSETISYDLIVSKGTLNRIIIPNTVKTIGEDAFLGCGAITSLTIPESVEEIGAWALDGLTALESITIYSKNVNMTESELSPDVKVYCYKGSTAETYAKQNGNEIEYIICDTHTFGEWTVIKNPTCIQKGTKQRVCVVCGEVEEEDVPITSHTLKTRCENKIAPTCTANGSVVKVTYCTICQTEISRTTEVLTALGHSPSGTISIYNKGHGYRCTRCGEIELTNHTYGEGTCVREATYALKGKYESVCTVCGYKGYYETQALEIEGEIVDGVYCENGVPTHKGLILMEDGYYYYIDANGNLVKDATRFVGNKWANAGVKAGEYTFDKNGRMVVNTTVEPTDREGIIDGIYYEFNEPVHKGVIKVDEDYYYVKSLGIVVKNTTKYINKQYSNGIIEPGTYEIDENGKIINPKVVGEEPEIDTSLNGIVGDYYYVEGIPTHVGFIKIGDYYYYIESGGKVVKNKTRFVYNNMTNGLLPQGFYSFDAEGHANVK